MPKELTQDELKSLKMAIWFLSQNELDEVKKHLDDVIKAHAPKEKTNV